MNILRTRWMSTIKNFTKYLFHDKEGREYFADIRSMQGCSEKNAILNFTNIWQNIWSQMIIVKFGQLCNMETEQIVLWAWNQCLLLRIPNISFSMETPILHFWLPFFVFGPYRISSDDLFFWPLDFREGFVQKRLSMRKLKEEVAKTACS